MTHHYADLSESVDTIFEWKSASETALRLPRKKNATFVFILQLDYCKDIIKNTIDIYLQHYSKYLYIISLSNPV